MEKGLELLAPAGNLEILKAVIRAGADAVYVGGDMFGARAYANNFSKEELLEAIRYGHIHHRKVILAVNTLLKNQEIDKQLFDYILPYYQEGIDAVSVQEYGAMRFIKEYFPDLPIHTSTQMTVTGVDGARMLHEKGAERIVTAREMSLKEIQAIHDAVDVEIESFVHGALCYCYSGQCLLSSMIGGRSGNRGRCAQPCRLPFEVRDTKNQLLNKQNPYILSLKDLNTIDFLPEMAESGIYSFKIEGRMKSVQYAAGVVSVYRYYMDQYLNNGTKNYQVSEADLQKLLDFGNRSGFTKGYYYVHNGKDMLTGETSTHSKSTTFDSKEAVDVFLRNEIKEKINGKLKLFKDTNAMLLVTDGSNQIEVTGNPVMQANNRPMTKENVEEKIKKTGNTPFVFDNIEIKMEDDIFLPVADLNHLRQEALEKLEELCLAPFHRNQQKVPLINHNAASNQSRQTKPELIVSAECQAGVQAALTCEDVATIYLDNTLYEHNDLIENLKRDIELCKNNGKKVFYLLPAVFRARTRSYYQTILPELYELPLDGFVVKSYDELAFFKDSYPCKKEIRIDHNMYTYSNYARESFALDGITRDTVPLELNRKEIAHRDNDNSEMILYGYLPLMVSAGCTHKNTAGCDQKSQTLYLQDRYDVTFPVRNCCSECYNVIYNTKPLFLFQHEKELGKLNLSAYRIHFAFETQKEAKRILAAYQSAVVQKAIVNPEEYVTDYTNGHYKRGVE